MSTVVNTEKKNMFNNIRILHIVNADYHNIPIELYSRGSNLGLPNVQTRVSANVVLKILDLSLHFYRT